MNDFKTFHDSTSQDVHSPTPSLAIAINLDAMLEHDERNSRGPRIYPFGNVRSSTSGSPAFSTGLPPPPRRNGKAGSRSSSLRDLSGVGSSSTRSSDATDPLLPFSGLAAAQPTVSNPFINAVPQLTRVVGPNGQNQGSDYTMYSPSTTGVSNSLQLASDRGVNPLETDHSHDLFISFRSRKAPTSTAYSMPRMERLVVKGEGMSGQSDFQLNSKKEESSATVMSRFKFPEGGSSVTSAKTLCGSESQNERDETFPTRLVTVLSRPADDLTALAESRNSSQHQSQSSELTHLPLTNSTPQPIGIPNDDYPSTYTPDLQSSQNNGPNNFYGNHISSPSSPSSESSIESSSSSPIFATSFDWSPLTSPTDVSRPALYTPERSGATLGSSGWSPSYATHPVMSSSSKPPLPTTPKPDFRRSTSANPRLNNSSRRTSPNPIPRFTRRQASPNAVAERLGSMPPTTNLRDPQERADLVKKNRKLAQMFGTTPGATVLSQKYDEPQDNCSELPYLLPSEPWNHGAALDDDELVSSWLTPQSIEHLASGRRHSEPSNPDVLHGEDHSTVGNIGTGVGITSNLASNRASTRKDRLSSHEGGTTPAILSKDRRLGLQHSPSTPSLSGASTVAEQEEVDRKRKRDQLAKLHRFLGSRVPIGLVLGIDHGDASLPPIALRTPDSGSKSDPISKGVESRKLWSARRRSSSAEVYPRLSQDLDRLKEDLSDEEKAINVRRAQKMEKVFGVLPPQALYHTRCSPSPIHPVTSPVSPSFGRWTAPPSPISQSRSPSQVFERNPNQSAYKSKSRKHGRPSTPESMQQLLHSPSRDSFYFNSQKLAVPNVYTHYQHSLHSLNDIIDRDDRASLVELHKYLQGEIPDSPLQEVGRATDHIGSARTSVNMGRRRSLPSAVLSTSADCNIPTVKPEATDFQLRRRRAAKLTQFFGVNYNQIIHDVLESIEKGVEEERKRGTLQPEEVEDLLQTVHTLKTKRSAIL